MPKANTRRRTTIALVVDTLAGTGSYQEDIWRAIAETFRRTGVGLLIHVYSIGYMKGDPGYAKFFAFLNLFVFAMLMLVLSSSLLGLFVGWLFLFGFQPWLLYVAAGGSILASLEELEACAWAAAWRRRPWMSA